MKSTQNQEEQKEISLARAGLISGIGLLIMALTVPFVEFYVFPQLISDNPSSTFKNITENKQLFTIGIFFHFITLICDVIVAWSLYIFLKPVFKSLSLLTASFRLIYTAMYLVALANLVKVLTIINNSTEVVNQTQINDTIMFYLNSFKIEWSFALLIFGIYLISLGYLVLKADYVPNIFGILLVIAGFGYTINTFFQFLFPNVSTGYLIVTFFGELIFMLWLLIKGSRLQTTK